MAPDSSIVWLASYPRSGNTWLRFLLFHLVHDEEATPAGIARFIPDLHVPGEFENSSAGASRALLAKTHHPWSERHPHAERTSAAIHLVRHPRDVLLSSLNFHKVLGTRTSSGELRDIDFARAFIAAGGDPVWISRGMGTWAQNARSWASAEGFPVLRVRYEALRAEPTQELSRIAAFLAEHGAIDAPPTPERIERSVALASFERMRAVEVRAKTASPVKSTLFGGDARTMRRGLYFMDKARVGARLGGIHPSLDGAFDPAFHAALHENGYTPDAS